MYAVIETGGKQYRVEEGDVIDIERAEADGSEDSKLTFDRVLMIGGGESVRVGAPVVAGASVSAVLVDEIRGPKIKVFKKKRRKGYKKLQGHRQNLLKVRIDAIEG